MAKSRLVDSVIAETYSDVLKLHAELEKLTAAAPALLLSLKTASDDASRTTRAVVVEIKAANMAMAEFVRQRNGETIAELDRLLTERTASILAAQAEAIRTKVEPLKLHVLVLSVLVGASLTLNAACVAFLLLH